MDKELLVEKIKYLSSMPHSSLIEHCIYLQQENEKLKELCDKYEEEHSNEFKIWKEERHDLLDYKSRCEKAIEYIKQNCEIRRYDDYDEIGKVEGIPLLNILQNERNKGR